eukprot:TRINITY_DN46099_c0_g1_i1.p1 TRINITY_DN46099_c0_g1~~TRINITY_DN46099_c0_g1_i1.p1  ORF type:complete len:323 (+),score=56.48 TRINITY_DN46099_c0_g1_i1:44-970(+)
MPCSMFPRVAAATVLGSLAVKRRTTSRCQVFKNKNLSTVISDPSGWSLELHSSSVLEANPKFKGSVWAPVGGPDGTVLFHNSVFSNWYKGVFTLRHGSVDICFGNSEAVIMAVKECHASGERLGTCLAKHSQLSPSDSKESAASSGDAYPLWGDHAFQTLLGASVCLLKFSQDLALREALLSTDNATLVESAPNDGAWGVAMNSQEFLQAGENPEDYSLQSTTQSMLHFTAGNWSGTRLRCEANALGKALMLVRSILRRKAESGLDEHIVFDLHTALDEVWEEVCRIPSPVLDKYKHARIHLMRLLEN